MTRPARTLLYVAAVAVVAAVTVTAPPTRQILHRRMDLDRLGEMSGGRLRPLLPRSAPTGGASMMRLNDPYPYPGWLLRLDAALVGCVSPPAISTNPRTHRRRDPRSHYPFARRLRPSRQESRKAPTPPMNETSAQSAHRSFRRR